MCYCMYDDGRDESKTQRLKRLHKGWRGAKKKTQSFSHLLQAQTPKEGVIICPSSCGDGNYTVFQHNSTLRVQLFSQYSQGGGQEAEISENSPWCTAFRCSGSVLYHIHTEHHWHVATFTLSGLCKCSTSRSHFCHCHQCSLKTLLQSDADKNPERHS